MGRVRDTRPEPLPDYGADHRLSLQLVEHFHAFGNTGQTRRSHHLAALGTARHRQANPARESDHRGDYQHPREGLPDHRHFDQGERLSKANKSDCGAVHAKREVEADPQCCVSSFLEGEGPWKHWPVRRCYRVTAVFRFKQGKPQINFGTNSKLKKAVPLKIERVYFKVKGRNERIAEAPFAELTDQNVRERRLTEFQDKPFDWYYGFGNGCGSFALEAKALFFRWIAVVGSVF